MKAGIAAIVLVMLAAPAGAHVEQGVSAATPWSRWPLAPDVLIGAALAAAFYVGGIVRRAERGTVGSLGRHARFFGGLAAILTAVQSPLDSAAQHSFLVHQVQHLLLYALGPLLIMWSAPQTLLIAGMPAWLLRGVVAPLMKSHSVRTLFAVLSQPAIATIIFVGSMWVWQLPLLHDLTLLDQPLHYLMHISMLFTGLVFFWRVLDARPPPQGAGYGTRIVMVTAAISGTLPLGAYLALKSRVLYAGYDWFGRLRGLTALSDEAQGGLIIWIPGGVISAIAILIVLRMWGRRETKSDDRRRLGRPVSIDRETSANRNRSLAIQLFLVSFGAFAFLIAVISAGLAIL